MLSESAAQQAPNRNFAPTCAQAYTRILYSWRPRLERGLSCPHYAPRLPNPAERPEWSPERESERSPLHHTGGLENRPNGGVSTHDKR